MTNGETNVVNSPSDKNFVKAVQEELKNQIKIGKLAFQKCENNSSDYLTVQNLKDSESNSSKLFSLLDGLFSFDLVDITFQLLCGNFHQKKTEEMKRGRKNMKGGGSSDKQIRYSVTTPRINETD